MQKKIPIPALKGWFTLNEKKPHLIGSVCNSCGTYYFPKQTFFCKNPDCDSTSFKEIELSRIGKIWSYTNSCYKPPEPFQSKEPFTPYNIAAVKLEKEKMIILGQISDKIKIENLKIDQKVELILETLYETEENIKLIWKWKPCL